MDVLPLPLHLPARRLPRRSHTQPSRPLLLHRSRPLPRPPGQTCASYTAPYIAQAGGYVQTGADGLCEFCQYANGDEFARGFNVYYDHKWRDYGIFWAFCIFNFVVVFAASWLYLGGSRI